MSVNKFCSYCDERGGSITFDGVNKSMFPEYDEKLSFMQQPTGYQDNFGGGIPIEAKTYRIEVDKPTKEKIRVCLEDWKDESSLRELFRIFFEMAITKCDIYNFYGFGWKKTQNASIGADGVLIPVEPPVYSTTFFIRGCPKVNIDHSEDIV